MNHRRRSPSDLQSDPFNHSGTPPKDKPRIVLIGMGIVNRKTVHDVEKKAIFEFEGKSGLTG